MRLKILALLMLWGGGAWAQLPTCNEWINLNQTYLRIPVAQTGMYRVPQSLLVAKGITGVDPRNFQLFHRGKEQAIIVAGEEDGNFDPADYIDFYGKQNDGARDTDIYRDPNAQLNKYYSLYTDTTAYFLTWAAGTAGKRVTKVNEALPAPAPAFQPYLWKQETVVYSEKFQAGQHYPLGTMDWIHLSQFDQGEGWGSDILIANYPDPTHKSRTMTFPVSQVYTGDPNLKPQLRIQTAGASYVNLGVANLYAGSFQVKVGTSSSNLTLLANVPTQYCLTSFVTLDLPYSYLTGTQLIVEVTPTQGSMTIAHTELTYPKTTTANPTASQLTTLPTNNSPNNFVLWNNLPANAHVYELTNNGLEVEFIGTPQASQTVMGFTNTMDDKLLFIDAGERLAPIGLENVNFQAIGLKTFDYLIITHPKLRKPAGNYTDPVQAYADYRASAVGGAFKPFIADINMLYDQFNYGERTPLAMRNFITWLVRNDAAPNYLFLVGLGTSFPDGKVPSLNFRQNPAHQAFNLIPVYNFPPSDIQMIEKIDGAGMSDPVVPVGRIGALTSSEVAIYLDKVKEHEQADDQLWQKNVIHLVGGKTESEQNAFGVRMNDLKTRAEGLYVGAKVKTTNKRTTGLTEAINMSEQVNEGVGLITFFGHSDMFNTDLEIGNCSDDLQGYRNKGKYPLMLANGCNLGGVFYNAPSLARDWLYTKDRGALAFIGHTYYGYSVILADYSMRFYTNIFQNPGWIGKPIGDIMKTGVATIDPHNAPELSTAQQMLLQGDPALRFFRANKTDYTTDDAHLYLTSFDNQPVTALTQSFKLNVVVSNLGLVSNQKIGIKVKRTYPDGSQYVYEYPLFANPIPYQDTIVVVMNTEPNEETFGSHTFEVTLDYENLIDEMKETNNTGTLVFFMPSTGVFPTMPQEFAIVNELPVTLIATSSRGINEGREFVFELDTTKTFNSPFKRSATASSGVTGSWEIASLISDNDRDSLVYYWRVNYADAVNDPNALWGYSSFTYIKNSPDGWTQRHFPQFERDELHYIRRNDAKRTWEFDEILRKIKVRTFGSTNTGDFNTDVYMYFEGLPYVSSVLSPGRCGKDAIACMAFDHQTGVPYLVFPNQACGRQPFVVNSYDNTMLNNGALNAYLDNVKPNDFVLFFSIGTVNFSTWTNTLRGAFSRIGGNPAVFNTLQTGHPYIILGRKGGHAGTAQEVIALSIANPKAEAVVLDAQLKIPYFSGEIGSTRIGPATGWKQLHYHAQKAGTSTQQVLVYGANLQGIENPVPLFTTTTASLSNPLSLASVNATQYPYLRLAFRTEDPLNKRAPAQLKNWLVLYNGVPDGMIDAAAIGQSMYVIPAKEEGQKFEVEFAYRNLTGLVFTVDSLTVQITRKNLTQLTQETKTMKIKAPTAKETVRFKYLFDTKGWAGKNEIKVYVNPRVVPERYYENNVLVFPVEVIGDKNNPLLEVAFDGRKILNGEIVSASPVISVQLFDDNKYVPANKPTNIQVSIKAPGAGKPFELVDMNASNVTWSYEAGKLLVNIKKEKLESGVYTLKAQGIDAMGNAAAADPYQIDFEVVRESSVTNVLPYPNPFSTKTRFVFTLTGDQVPDEMKIQIMTVAGKVVREITQSEIGAIRVGHNQSEYAWDGTDEYGEKLANGVYLYKVIMKKNGKIIEHRANSTDKAFKHGIGKLYIAR